MSDGPTASEVFAAARARQDSSGGGGSGGDGGGDGGDGGGDGGDGGGDGGVESDTDVSAEEVFAAARSRQDSGGGGGDGQPQPPGAGPATLPGASDESDGDGQTPASTGGDTGSADVSAGEADTLPGGPPDAGETVTQPDAERPESIESREDVAQLAEFRAEQELGQDVTRDQITVEPQGVKDGQRQFSFELTDEARAEIAAERTEGVTEGDITVAADGELSVERSEPAPEPTPETSAGPAAEPPIEQQASQRQALRDRVVEQVEEQAQEQVLGAPGAAAVDIAERATGRELIDFEAGTDVALEQQAGQIRAELTDRRRRQIATDTIEGQLEAETGASLDDEDIRVEEGDGGALVGRLSEEGQKTVAVQNNPFTDAPVIGGAVETGVRARQEFIDVTDPVAEDFREASPSKGEFIGGLAAAAPVAAAEPTPFGELGLGAAAAGGAAVLGGAALAEAARGNEPTARERSELDIGEVSVPELEAPDDTDDTGELQPGDRQVSELEPGGRVGNELSVPTDTGRDVTTLVTGEQLGQQQRQEREQPAPDQPTITRDDIRGDIGEPEQRGPSVREQQRRDELFPPEREFPTGESAVVGRGTAEDVSENVVERQQEAQRSQLVDGTRVGRRGETALGTDQQPRQDVGLNERADAATQTAADIDQQLDQILETPQIAQPDLEAQTSTENQPAEELLEQGFGGPPAQAGQAVDVPPVEVAVRRGKSRLPREQPESKKPEDEPKLPLSLRGIREVVLSTDQVFGDSDGDGAVEPIVDPEPVVDR